MFKKLRLRLRSKNSFQGGKLDKSGFNYSFWFTVLTGVIVSFGIAFFLYKVETDKRQHDFDQLAGVFNNIYQERFKDLGDDVHSVTSFFRASTFVDREEFKKFTEPLIARRKYIQFVGWLPRVASVDRGAFESEVRNEGFKEYQITQKDEKGAFSLDKVREEYFPVNYAVPFSENSDILGFNFASEKVRRHYLDLARDTGDVVISSFTQLFVNQGKYDGLILFGPIYRNNSAVENLSERRVNLQGIVVIVFRLDLLVKEISSLVSSKDFNIELKDLNDLAQPVFYASPGVITQRKVTYKHDFEFGMRKYSITCVATADFLRRYPLILPWFILCTGLFFTVFVVFILGKREQSLNILHQERLELALSSAGMGAWSWDIKNDIRHFDDQVCRILGIDARNFHGSANEFFSAVHPQDKEYLRVLLGRTVAEGLLYEPEYRVIWPDSSLHYVASKGKLIRDHEGNSIAVNGVIWDISERKHLEEEVKINYNIQNALNSVLNFSLKDVGLNEILKYALDVLLNIPNLAIEHKGAILLVDKNNPGVLTMRVNSGLSDYIREKCAAVPLGVCICGRAALTKELQFVDHVNELHEINYQGMAPHGHYCVPILFGEKLLGVIVLYSKEGEPFSIKGGEVLTAIANALAGILVRKEAQDELGKAYIELKNTHAQLVQASKMSALGQLAGGVAHEINNPLVGVLNNVQLIKIMGQEKRTFEIKEFEDLLSVIESSALRCQKITQALLNFARAPKEQFSKVQVNEVIQQVLSLAAYEMSLRNVRIKTELAQDLSWIMGESQLLQQVVFGLLNNARWAIEKKADPEGGDILIKTWQVVDKKSVHVSISDTGTGIAADDLEKIFEPFFTTKPVGEGTGLGLSLAYSIIKTHQGAIAVKSEVNVGTTFTLTFSY